jgi:hypothetical protein
LTVHLSKDEGGETGGGGVDQRNLTSKAFIANIASKMENERQESVMKLAQTHDVACKNGAAADFA